MRNWVSFSWCVGAAVSGIGQAIHGLGPSGATVGVAGPFVTPVNLEVMNVGGVTYETQVSQA